MLCATLPINEYMLTFQNLAEQHLTFKLIKKKTTQHIVVYILLLTKNIIFLMLV